MGVSKSSMSRPQGETAAERKETEQVATMAEGKTPETVKTDARALQRMAAELRAQANQRVKIVQNTRVTPSMPRDKTLDDDPTVTWTGHHYQRIDPRRTTPR